MNRLLLSGLTALIGLPYLLAYSLPPSSTLLNQAVALVVWGVAAAACCKTTRWPAPTVGERAGVLGVSLALGVLLLAGSISVLDTTQPRSLTMSAIGIISASTVAFACGARGMLGRVNQRADVVLWAFVLAGTISLCIGIAQVLGVEPASADWIAPNSSPGRAVGNLRQPNHLSTLLIWSAIATLWMHEVHKRTRFLLQGLYVAMIGGVAMTASRTGLVGILILALWGFFDQRNSRTLRRLLIATPLIYAAWWLVLIAWAHSTGHSFSGEGRLTADGDLSSSRFAIWSNTLELIRQNPWFGVGFGEFNFAWTLTPFPDRPVAFFDHTHNLPLQFAVELGLPLATVILTLLTYALWRAFQASREASSLDGTTLRCAFMMVLMMALHSQLEYPLWYAYFLLPTAFLWGLCLGGRAGRAGDADTVAASAASAELPSGSASFPSSMLAAAAPHAASFAAPSPARIHRTPASRLLMLAGAAMMVSGVLVVVDYMKVVAIFAPASDAAPLPERVAVGQRSWFFSHHADYAAATTAAHTGEQLEAAKRAAHYLLDTRLMIAWSRAYAERGDLDRARHIAARLREFRNPDAAGFFAPCNAASADGAARPYQCDPPGRTLTYRDFR